MVFVQVIKVPPRTLLSTVSDYRLRTTDDVRHSTVKLHVAASVSWYGWRTTDGVRHAVRTPDDVRKASGTRCQPGPGILVGEYSHVGVPVGVTLELGRDRSLKIIMKHQDLLRESDVGLW